MKEMIEELVQYRQLLYMLTARDIKIRYKQTVMGFLWAILMPLFIVSAGMLVKKGMSMFSGKPLEIDDLVSVAVKSLPYAFFIGSVRFATNSLVSNRNLVTKIYFPREVFPISAVLANLFDFVIAAAVLCAILAFTNVPIGITVAWIPAVLLFLVLFTIGIGMLLACANLFYRDVKYIVEIIVTFAIFFTPVFYEASLFGKWSPLLLMNPVGAMLEAIHSAVVLQRAPDAFWFVYSAAWSVGTFLLGWGVFHKLEFSFAENI
jgi:lipopolysaccharide transport system permease protein